MIIQPIKTRIFREREDLLAFVLEHIPKLKERSVLVITSKIVALAEGRTSSSTDEKTKERLIKAESEFAIKTKYVWLTIKDGSVMASAGIDESNADGKLILLPKDSWKSAEIIRKQLMKKFRLKELGIIITDSRTIPLRAGVSGIATGYAGFRGVKSYIGKKDIFGRGFAFSRTDVADSLATAAVLVMGEGAERHPLALVTKGPIEFCARTKKSELYIDPAEDMYKPLFSRLF